MRTIDCRGLTCPQPVLETKKALEKIAAGEIFVLLDDPGSKENVCRFAESQGHRVTVAEEKGVFTVKIQKGEVPVGGETSAVGETPAVEDFVILIDSDSLGRGSEELGRVLIRSFMHTLRESSNRPAKVIFINSGVKLACEGSAVLDDLEKVSSRGTEIISCGTCLDYFRMKEKLRIGRISNMYEILHSLVQAGKVVKV